MFVLATRPLFSYVCTDEEANCEGRWNNLFGNGWLELHRAAGSGQLPLFQWGSFFHGYHEQLVVGYLGDRELERSARRQADRCGDVRRDVGHHPQRTAAW
jgi:hypothetical protein